MASAEGARFRPFVSEVKISLLPLIFPRETGTEINFEKVF